ncbi:MAG: hypothetical protein JXB48_22800, partial [Candidatus Latescibacteria bacterium]|nr:hypothetical protein [Candidatus Latescibacterota bacterium]
MKIKVYVILLLLFSKVSYGNENWTTWTSPPTVLSIAFENNTIWCGTDGDGIIAYNKITGDQQIFTTENGLIDNYVYSIAIDNDGVKWFGTKGGISQYDGYNWVSHPINQESFPYGSKINDIIVDHQNKIWVATSKGIYNFNSTQWETKQSGYFNCIAIDNRGIIWAGDSQFFLRLEGTEAIKIGSDVSAVNVGQVKDIIYDKYKNRIFCAVHKGFVTYDDAAEELTVFPSLTSYQVITTDNNGTIWFGNDEGITSIFEEKTTRFTVNDGLPDNNIKTLAFDNDGILWIGDQRGLSSFDGESFKMHLAPYSSNIASIVID